MKNYVLTSMSCAYVVSALVWAHAGGQTSMVRIGMAKSFITDKPSTYIEIATNDFKKVLKETSGLEGKITSSDGAFEIAQKLDKKELDFAILYAHEFAWVQKKHPDLQPLFVAGGKRVEKAYIVVHKKNDAKTVADLKGKTFDLPMGAGEPCRLFVIKQTGGKAPAEFFGSVKKSESQGDALDEVARENAQATVVDTHALDFFKEIKAPIFAKHLRILQESEAFPPAVIVYKKGGVPDATLTKFRDGILKAPTTELGRDMMKSWNIDAFEPAPKDYDQQLAAILKAYPPAP